MPPADGWTEAPSGGHPAAPGALPPRAACTDQGPFRTWGSGAGVGAGEGAPVSGQWLGGVFLARIGEGAGGVTTCEDASAPGDTAGGRGPGTQTREDTRPTLGGNGGGCGAGGKSLGAAARPSGPDRLPGNPAEAGLTRDRWCRSRRDAHPPKMATPGETLPRGQPC